MTTGLFLRGFPAPRRPAPPERVPRRRELVEEPPRRLPEVDWERLPEYLSPEQAKEAFDVDLQPGWQLRIKRTTLGVDVRYITPDKWEILEGGKYFFSPEGKFYSARELERERRMALLAPEQFERERLARAAEIVFPEGEIESLFREMTILPDMPEPERIRAEQAQWDFVDTIRAEGRTWQTEALLRQLGATEEEIGEFFPAPTWDEAKWWAERHAGMSLPERIVNQFFAGVGDVISTTGGTARWLGYEDIGGMLSAMGSDMQRLAPPRGDEEFEFADLLDPEFYATKVVRAIPFPLAIAPAAIAAFYGGVAIAGASGLGTLGSMLIGGFTSAVVSRPIESALEAGSQYDDAIARGRTEKEAKEEADRVFRENMVLAGADAFEIMIALAPTPKWVPLRLVRSGLVRTARIGTKMVIIGLSEGGEEIYQDIIQRRARGEEWQWDPISKEVFAIGMIMGMGMGLGGDIVSSIVNKSKDKMPAPMKRDFDGFVSSFREEGFMPDQAELRALDRIARTPEGQRIVAESIKEVKREIPVIPEVVPEVKFVAVEEVAGGYRGIVISDQGTRIPMGDLAVTYESARSNIVTFARENIVGIEKEWGKRGYTFENIKAELKLIPKPPAVVEVKPEVFITPKQWETIPETSRAKALAEAGLDRELKEKTWADLTPLEKDALGESYIAPDKPITPEQRAEIERLAKAKLLMTEEGKPTPALRNLLKGLVGKNKIDNLTQSEADTVIEALGLLEVKYGRAPKIPTTTGLITKEFADKIPYLKEIGIMEKIRPTRQVFQKMGLRAEIFEPAFKAETEIYEELMAYRREAREVKKWVGKDPIRRMIVFRELENPGSQVGLTFNEKRAVTWFRKYFDDWANKLNLPAEKRRQNYVTHIFEAEIAAELKTKHPLDPALIKAMDFITPKTIFNPFLQKRLGQTIGLKEDPFAAASAYEARALKVYHYEPLIQKIRIYERYLPPHSARYLRNFITRMTGRPLTVDRELNQTIGEFAKSIEKLPGGAALARQMTRGNFGGLAAYNFTSSLYFLWLGFKPTSAIRNLSQHTLALAEVGPIHFSAGIGLRFTKEGKAALKESFVLRSRRQAFLPGIDASFASRWVDTVREKALWMFRYADRQNVSDSFLCGYAEAKSHFPEAGRELWIKRGDEVAGDTQYIYTQLGGAAWSQSAMGRFLSILTTWPENWVELMTKWVKARPSYVYQEYAQTTGRAIPVKNWSQTHKALLLYLAIVVGGYFLKEHTRLKAWEYTGLTSLRYLADLASGEFPALEYPGAVADVIVGFLTDDERRLKSGWARLKPINMMGIVRQLDNVISGEKDWLTLFFYLQGADYPLKQLRDRWEKDFKPYQELETTEERNAYRKDNPLIEAKLFITGQFTVLSSDEARAEALRLIEKHNLDPELIDGYEKVFGVDTNIELTKLKGMLGLPEITVLRPGEEIEYITTSNFASEVNKLERVMGRYKLEKDGHPLALEYLRAKDQWEAYYDLPEEGRRLYRQQFPDIEAQLYLWGKISSFVNPKSAEILLGLMDKYDIPPEAIPAFLDKPERYDELFTDLFKLKQKWFDLETEYENYGNPDSPTYIDEEELRKEAREKLKIDNPDWMSGRRHIEALEHDAPDKVAQEWIERGKLIDEFSAGSSEVKVWLLDHKETWDWALEQGLLTDDGVGWNESVLRLNVKWAKEDEKYDALKLPAYSEAIAHIKRARASHIPVEGVLIDDWNQAWIDNYDFILGVIERHKTGQASKADISKATAILREDIKLDEPPGGWEKWKREQEAQGIVFGEDVVFIHEEMAMGYRKVINLLEDIDTAEARERLLKLNPEYAIARLKRDAHTIDFPEAQIDAYVEYYQLPVSGFRQERYLIEHPEFAKNMHNLKGIDLPKPQDVPSVRYDEIYEKWQDEFDKLWNLGNFQSKHYIEDEDKRAKVREAMRRDAKGNLTEFGMAEIRHSAYASLFPEELIDTYVEYYSVERRDYEDDWFLMEHHKFYAAARKLLGWQLKDFSNVPSRRVWEKYVIYQGLPLGRIRLDFRAQNPDLEKWLVDAKGYKPLEDRGDEDADLSKWEKLAEELLSLEERLRKLRE